MDYLFQVTILLICSLRYTESKVCPIGYVSSQDSILEAEVISENMTWSNAVMECTRLNATIITVKDHQAEQAVKDAMDRYSISNAWIGYSDNLNLGDTKMVMSDTAEPYFTMGNISDDNYMALSSFSDDLQPKYAKINSQTAWVSKNQHVGEWVQVNLGRTMCIYGIVTKGRGDVSQWTTAYKLQYSYDGDNFSKLTYEKQEILLIGNYDSNTPVYWNFTKPFNAQFVRLYPYAWHSYIAIRFDLLVSHNSCPSDFDTCGKCPMASTNGSLQFQFMSCCTKLPYICVTETEVCVPAKENSTMIDNALKDQELDFSPLVIGLLAGVVAFGVISIILLILLLLTLFKHRGRDRKYSSKVPQDKYNENNDGEMNQNVAKVPSNLQLKSDPKDLYTQVNVETKSPKLPVIYYNTKDITNTTDDADGANYIEDVLYDTPADSDNDENKIVFVKDGDNQDRIEMVQNDIYLDYL